MELGLKYIQLSTHSKRAWIELLTQVFDLEMFKDELGIEYFNFDGLRVTLVEKKGFKPIKSLIPILSFVCADMGELEEVKNKLVFYQYRLKGKEVKLSITNSKNLSYIDFKDPDGRFIRFYTERTRTKSSNSNAVKPKSSTIQ